MTMPFKIRPAVMQDVPVIYQMIRELAAYEKLEDRVTGTEEGLAHTLFGVRSYAEVLLLEEDGHPVGFVLFFHNYSTFLCQYGLYIEDLYIREACRGKGYGKALFKHICALALERDCGRVEWWCLDWNKPSIDFYCALGAQPMSEWTVYRLDRQGIEKWADDQDENRPI